MFLDIPYKARLCLETPIQRSSPLPEIRSLAGPVLIMISFKAGALHTGYLSAAGTDTQTAWSGCSGEPCVDTVLAGWVDYITCRILMVGHVISQPEAPRCCWPSPPRRGRTCCPKRSTPMSRGATWCYQARPVRRSSREGTLQFPQPFLACIRRRRTTD